MAESKVKAKSTARINKERGSKFEAYLKESVKMQDMAYTRLRDVSHLTTTIRVLTGMLKGMGRSVPPMASSSLPNPCDFIVGDRSITVYYEAKSTLHELQWSDIKQYRRPDDETKSAKFNDYWQPQNNTLSGIIVEFCDTGEYYFVACADCEKLRQTRKTGFDAVRVKAFGYKIEQYKPEGLRKLRLDFRRLHNKLYRDFLAGQNHFSGA